MSELGISIEPVKGRTHMRAFLDVPNICQGIDPMWVPPLEMMVRDQLNPKKNPWFGHGVAQLFVAYRGDKPVGRISAQIDQSHLKLRNDATGFFGFFECVDDQAVADTLFTAAQGWLKGKGISRLRGPFSLNTNEESGMLVDGFESPPRMLMGHAPKYYQDLVQAAGFEGVRDLLAYLTPMDTALPYKYLELLKRLTKRTPELTFRHLDPNNYDRDIKILVDLFNAAWSENWGFIPLTEKDARHMAKEFKLILIPELVWFAFNNNEPAAMAVALPDLNEMIRDLGGKLSPINAVKLAWRLFSKRSFVSGTRVPLMGVAPRYKNTSLGSVLALMVIGSIRTESLKLNMPVCEMSWVLEDNAPTRHSIESIGGRIYKTYRIYEKLIA